MDSKKIVIQLIKDDITNNKLIDGLNNLGMEADHYHLYLSEVIFNLIGFKIDNTNFDRVYGSYDRLTKDALEIDLRKRDGSLDKLATKVHHELCQLRDLIIREKGEN